MNTSENNEKENMQQSEAQNNVPKDVKSNIRKDITDEAQDVLYESQDVVLQTRKAFASTYANPLLVLWGLLWVIACLASYFYLNYAFRIFMFMAMAGGLGTALIFKMLKYGPHIKETSEDAPKVSEDTPCSRMGLRIAARFEVLYYL